MNAKFCHRQIVPRRYIDSADACALFPGIFISLVFLRSVPTAFAVGLTMGMAILLLKRGRLSGSLSDLLRFWMHSDRSISLGADLAPQFNEKLLKRRRL